MTRRPLVYVAGPYTTPEPVGMNVKRAVEVGSRMLDAGLAPIVPHLSHYWHLADPHPYEAWLALDFEIIRRCDHVYRMPGVSPGADREVAFARDECDIPVWLPEHGTLEQFIEALS